MIDIIFDSTILLNYSNKNSGRSGIFFFAYNVLVELLKRDDVRVSLWAKESDLYYLKKMKKDLFPNVESIYLPPDKYDFLFAPKVKLDLMWNKYVTFPLVRMVVSLVRLIYDAFLRFFFRGENTCNKRDLKKFDFFFEPFGNAPKSIHKELVCCNVFHDAIPLKFSYMGWSLKKNLQEQIASVTKKDISFFVSENTKADFCTIDKKFDSEDSVVIPLAASGLFKPVLNNKEVERVRNKYRIPPMKKYVFGLCTLEPRKNLFRIINCFCTFIEKNQIEDIVFVLGGGQWDLFQKKNNVHWNEKQVVRAGYIDDEDLPVLYSNAEWFVYTSQYEGFGLPVLEAMQCGCPVIVGNNSSLPEVVGDAGIMIDWDSDKQHVEAFEEYYYNTKKREKNRRNGLIQAGLFSWNKTADGIVSAMQKHLSKNAV